MIINPTQTMLDNSYKANKYIANYLIRICGIEPLYSEDKQYYFAKTCELRGALSRIPFLLKFWAGF
jgi:hypothetical protein